MATAISDSAAPPSDDFAWPSLRALHRLGLAAASLGLLFMVAGGLREGESRRTPGGGEATGRGGCDGRGATLGCGAAAAGGGGAAKSCGAAGSKALGTKTALSSAAKVGVGTLGKGAAVGLLAVETGGTRSFITVGAHALEEGANIASLRRVVAQYPEVAAHAGNSQWLTEFSHTHPRFAEDVGKELYFTRPQEWAAYGGEKGLAGVGARHSLSFSIAAKIEAENRFAKVMKEMAWQLLQNVDLTNEVVDKLGEEDGVDVEVKDGMVAMKMETPESIYQTKPVPLGSLRDVNGAATKPHDVVQVIETPRPAK